MILCIEKINLNFINFINRDNKTKIIINIIDNN